MSEGVGRGGEGGVRGERGEGVGGWREVPN